jgi:hypothetical protein
VTLRFRLLSIPPIPTPLCREREYQALLASNLHWSRISLCKFKGRCCVLDHDFSGSTLGNKLSVIIKFNHPLSAMQRFEHYILLLHHLNHPKLSRVLQKQTSPLRHIFCCSTQNIRWILCCGCQISYVRKINLKIQPTSAKS